MQLSRSSIARRAAIVLAAAYVQPAAVAVESAPGTWRCGNTYTDQPCKGGKVLSVDDARHATQKHEADKTTREAQASADRMERDRMRLESTLGQRHATLIDNKPHRVGSSSGSGSALKKKKGSKRPEEFSAHSPASTPKKAVRTSSKRAARS